MVLYLFGAGKLLVDLFLSCFGIYSACGSKIDNWVGWFARYGSYVFIGSSRCLSSLKRTYSLIVSPTKRARLTGTAFPIICSLSVLFPENLNVPGNVCMRARSSAVSARIPSSDSTGSPGCKGYPLGMGRLTPLIVGLGSWTLNMPRRT